MTKSVTNNKSDTAAVHVVDNAQEALIRVIHVIHDNPYEKSEAQRKTNTEPRKRSEATARTAMNAAQRPLTLKTVAQRPLTHKT